MSRTDLQHWITACASLSAAGEVSAVHERLVTAYAEPQRHYHNLQHISECLAEFDGARTLAQHPAEVEMALWFHDAVYDPRSGTNEEDSARLAEECLTAFGVQPNRVKHIAELALATKTHDSADVPDAALLIDIDLAILGQPAERFWRYETAIAAEYAWVPASQFASARAEILTRFLGRQVIFRIEFFRTKYEAAARANLAAAIEYLRSPS